MGNNHSAMGPFVIIFSKSENEAIIIHWFTKIKLIYGKEWKIYHEEILDV